MKNAVALATLASCVAAVCRAATLSPPAPESLLACASVHDPGERVRCYDGLVEAMKASAAARSAPTAASAAPQAPPTTAAVATPPPSAPTLGSAASAAPRNAATSAAAAAEQSSEAKFGQEQLPAASRPKPTQQEEVLASVISSVRVVGPKIYIISLANGQVWQQDGEGVTAFFRTGDDVRIEKGTFGSYHMSTSATGAKNWVRVTRLR